MTASVVFSQPGREAPRGCPHSWDAWPHLHLFLLLLLPLLLLACISCIKCVSQVYSQKEECVSRLTDYALVACVAQSPPPNGMLCAHPLVRTGWTGNSLVVVGAAPDQPLILFLQAGVSATTVQLKLCTPFSASGRVTGSALPLQNELLPATTGCTYDNYYKPSSKRCLMHKPTVPEFCAACVERQILSILQHTGELAGARCPRPDETLVVVHNDELWHVALHRDYYTGGQVRTRSAVGLEAHAFAAGTFPATHPRTKPGAGPSPPPPTPPPGPCVTCPTSDVVVSTLHTSLSKEMLTVKHCQCCGMGGTPRGRSSNCEQTDNCPTVTHQH